ncbi:ScpA family protein [Streptomyces sp. NA02536]|uniref:segregation and condensation protein A n=1 Tax=Streptomyces sp. NA02536 TaxID=2742133 RepID=UPI001591FD9A|nr:segregation/condensation protein A [Streptomyces sp. NA02536]QKV99677.1 segregation/condensation protein A [Streptomyces sp. NA02536]
MTSNDAPTPGARPSRRRTLGRGPASAPAATSGTRAGETGVETPPETPSPAEPAPAPAAPEREPLSDGPGRPQPRETPVEAPEGGSSARRPTTESRVPEAAAESAAPAPAPQAPPKVSAAPGGVEPRHAPQAGAAPGRAEPVRAPEAGGGPGGAEPARAPQASPKAGGAEPVREPGGGPEAAGDGRFKVRLANFEGPFDLLLQLISKHKLDVTEVALSRVTDEFMAYIRAMGPDWDLDETTEFLVVAATLLDLKAARLLPAAEVEDEADLALLEARDLLFARLLQYRAYKQIADIFSRRLDDEGRRYPRTVGLEPHHAELLPDVVISIGLEGFARLAVKAMQPRPKPQVYVDHIHAPLVSVQEQAGIVVARLRELGEASFRSLVQDTDDTLTVVARFLALLELYREKAVALDQETALGELTVRWTGGDGDAAPAVTDEFDRPPEQPKEESKP